ncbi:MAG: helix-turn-helix domain-containing protein [Armatimonadetes bacterium]|nr:helix-turn-helix domain-containing protein [Armatimonadota bacterium]
MGHTLTTKEVAARLGVTAGEVRRLLRTRRPPGSKRGRAWRVRKADLEAFLTEPLVEEGQVDEAEGRRAARRPGISLEQLRARLGL